MIKSTDLRIGNWYVNQWGEYLQVDPDLFGADNLESYPIPIPLNHEILEKCGFDVVHKTNNHYAINDPNGIKDSHKISVFPTVNNQWHIAFSDTLNGYNDYTPTTKIQYLHQLQNLYYSLTNEELEFKP